MKDKSKEDKTVVKSNDTSSDTTGQQIRCGSTKYRTVSNNHRPAETNSYKIRAEDKQTVIEQSTGPGTDLIDAIIEILAND